MTAAAVIEALVRFMLVSEGVNFCWDAPDVGAGVESHETNVEIGPPMGFVDVLSPLSELADL